MSFFDSDVFAFVLLPLLIFIARICDVTLGTMRIISVSQGRRYISPILGFFEVLIWIMVISKVMQNMDNPVCYLAYAGGFAAGNFVGILLEKKVALGNSVVRIITPRNTNHLQNALSEAGYGVTSVEGEGSSGAVTLIYCVIKRANLRYLIEIVEKTNPKAFYSIEDVRHVNEGIFPVRKSGSVFSMFRRPGK